MLSKHIIFVGFMGVGKSTIGQRVAKALSRDFIDTDKAIEQRFQASIPQIFEQWGEPAFREAERETILDICQDNSSKVIALGGGAYLNEDIRRVCQQCGIVFYLHLSWEQWLKRLPLLRDDRPLLQHKSLAEIEELYQRRQAIYEVNTTKVVVDGLEPDEAAEQVLQRLQHLWKQEKETDSAPRGT